MCTLPLASLTTFIVYIQFISLRLSHLPSEETKTTPSPIARGPPMFRNFSLGAHMARADKPNRKEIFLDLFRITIMV